MEGGWFQFTCAKLACIPTDLSRNSVGLLRNWKNYGYGVHTFAALAPDYFVLKLYWCPLLILPKGFMTIQSLEDYISSRTLYCQCLYLTSDGSTCLIIDLYLNLTLNICFKTTLWSKMLVGFWTTFSTWVTGHLVSVNEMCLILKATWKKWLHKAVRYVQLHLKTDFMNCLVNATEENS